MKTILILAALAMVPVSAQYSTPMRDVDNVGRNPTAFTANFSVAGSAFSGSVNLPAVPSGKRLVIDHITINGMLFPTDTASIALTMTSGGSLVLHYLPFPHVGSIGSLDLCVGTFPVTFVADPGSTVNVVFARNQTNYSLTASYTVSIAGHYVTLP
ncbi:MAG: hypothetical protein LAO79_26625 [Acidobacteriia bacterium]|nr:hypothetical protein [Terriglobia bacterium]